MDVGRNRTLHAAASLPAAAQQSSGIAGVVRETSGAAGVTVEAASAALIEKVRTVGTLQETVTVTGARPLVDTSNVREQSVLSRELVDTLPISSATVSY